MLVFVMVFVLVMTVASVAVARIDRFGAGPFSAPYAPYTAGPAVDVDDYSAPYSVGPHIPTTPPSLAPYAPYTAGPVVPETEVRPYAPYTAGPVVPEDEGSSTKKPSRQLMKE